MNLRSPSIFGKVSDQSLVLIRKYCSDHSLFGNPSLFGIVANSLNLTKQSLHRTTGYPIGTCLDRKTRVQNTFARHTGTSPCTSSSSLLPPHEHGLLYEKNGSCVDMWQSPCATGPLNPYGKRQGYTKLYNQVDIRNIGSLNTFVSQISYHSIQLYSPCLQPL